MVSILCTASLALAVLAVPARAGVISSVIAFGDSLIDDGNTTLMPARPLQPPAPYAGGRYTNGPTPTEVLATHLGVPLRSYAIGGAVPDRPVSERQFHCRCQRLVRGDGRLERLSGPAGWRR
jgi:hypothetical protein